MKYTLFCVRGALLHPDRHFLILGRWLPFSHDYVILQHGELADQLARQIMNDRSIPVFLDNRYHTLTIENCYSSGYRQRKNVEDLQQFIGYLHQKRKGLYMGVLSNED